VTLGASAALWLLLAVPLLVLLHMLRVRREARVVSSVLFWQHAVRDLQTRFPVRRLERSLLLLLQVVAVTLLALALARPSLTLPGAAGPALVLVLDTSLSMQATDVPPSRFARAQAEALALLARGGSGRPAMVVAAGPRPRIVHDLSRDATALAAAIRRLRPTDGRADLEGAVELAAAQRAEGRAVEVVLFTDRPWPATPGVTVHQVGTPAPNVAITRAAVRVGDDGQDALLVEVANLGPQPRRARLRVAWPDGTTTEGRLALPAEARTVRVWPARSDGVVRVVVRAPDGQPLGDALPADDAAEVVVGDALRPRVLLIGPGNPFLEAALDALPVREVRRAARADPAAWGAFDLVVLDRTPPMALPPGRYIVVGTVPEGLPVSRTGRAQGLVVTRAEEGHPLLRAVDLVGTRVDEAAVLRPRAGQVLAEGGVPLLWLFEDGARRVLLVPFDLARSDLPLSPAFPLLLANAVEWLAGPVEVPAGEAPLLPAIPGSVLLVGPDGRSTPVRARDGVLALPALDRAGVYRVRGEGWERALVVTRPGAEESDLRAPPVPPGGPARDAATRRVEVWAPLLAAAVLLLGVEWLLWRRSLPPPPRRARGRPRPLHAVRWVVVALLVLGLAGVEVAGGGGELAVVFAVDLSRSLPYEARERALGLMRRVAAAAHPGTRFGVVTFAGSARVAEGLTAKPRFPLPLPADPDRTDIGAAVRAALTVLPPAGHRRVVLLTDGQDTAGEAAAAMARARLAGVEVGVVPLTDGVDADVAVEGVRAPPVVHPGQRYTVEVAVESTAPASGTVRLLADGREVWRRAVAVPAGRSVWRIPHAAAGPGVVRYTAEVRAEPDAREENNRGHAAVAVAGPPAVLYVAAEPGPLPVWLAAQGLRVRTVPPEALPADAAGLTAYAAVVLDDVAATRLSPPQMRALHDYVAAAGGGLVAVGGPHAFGVGGYAGTDLEAALPVSMDVRHRVALPSLALVLVIDASGSMGSFGPETPKVELAKEAAQATIDLLGEQDLIGVLAFDQEPRWLVRPTRARDRGRILQLVSRLTAGGGTNMAPALREAHRALRGARARIKHVIVLSDGQTEPGDFERIVGQMRADRITVSSVAIGADADRALMRNLAAWGRGRSYVTRDLYSIPQIFTAEALLATRAYLVEERTRPVTAPDSPLVHGPTPPPLRGYVATAPKPAATLHLVTPQEDPLLATWQYGLGRALAFTSDARPRWAVEWVRWPEAARFWSRAVRWAMGTAGETAEVAVRADDRHVHVVVDARAPDGTLRTDLQVEARLGGDPATAAAPVAQLLPQTAPGRYEGSLPARGPGLAVVTAEVRRGAQRLGVVRRYVAVPYPPELRPQPPGAVGRLVEGAGVRPLAGVEEILAPVPGSPAQPRRAWPWLTAAAVALFLGEITWRRLPVVGEWVGRAGALAAAWLRRRPAPPAPEDLEYDAADRWRVFETEEAALRRASMEQAARLYIARLRQQQGGEERGEEEGRGAPPTV
jgi:Mg-chelatase subunit ChlD